MTVAALTRAAPLALGANRMAAIAVMAAVARATVARHPTAVKVLGASQRRWMSADTAPEAAADKEGTDSRVELYVDGPSRLHQLIGHCQAAQSVALDTEFIPFPSLVPKLQLVQIATPTSLAVVDYPAIRRDGLKDLMDVVGERECVLHGSTTDLRLIGHLTGRLPARVFDTQVAAGFVGMGQKLALGQLLSDLLKVDVDKSLTMTDWAKRPLSAEQISYAMNDVRYLLQARDKLHNMMVEKGRLHMFQEEMSKLSEPETYYPTESNECWKAIRKSIRMEGQELAILREVAAWRDIKSRDTNTWPNLIARDDLLLAFAEQKPTTLQQIKNIQGVKPYFTERYGVEILARVKKGLNTPESEWPVRSVVDELPNHEQSCLIHCLQAWVRTKAVNVEIAGNLLVADPDDLKRIAIYPVDELEEMNIDVLRGWRREVVGNDLLEIKLGKKSLRIDPLSEKLRLE